MRSQPDFLIVGAQRCGTTSMFKALVQHPLVARPFLRKGVHYFDKHYDEGAGLVPRPLPGARDLGAAPARPRVGRSPASPARTTCSIPLAPHRIAADLPDVRVIALLRDPVERAYSAHSHESGKGFEKLSFAEAVEAEPDRIAGERERMLADPSYASSTCSTTRTSPAASTSTSCPCSSARWVATGCTWSTARTSSPTPESVFPAVLEFLDLPPTDGIAFEKHNSRSRSASTRRCASG